MAIVQRPAYRIETERLVIRCYEPADAAALRAAVGESREHLLPWMDWARDEPAPLAEVVARIRRFRAQYDLGVDLGMGVFEPDGALVGGTGFHPRIGPGAAEIGYWVHVDRAGSGYATEVAAALTRVGLTAHGYRKLEIRAVAENVASARIPRRLGYRHDGTVRSHVPGVERSDPWRDVEVHSLLAVEFAGSEAAERSRAVRALDVLGEPLVSPEAATGPARRGPADPGGPAAGAAARQPERTGGPDGSPVPAAGRSDP